jgi:Periplasmic copper-binding protein (NosD)
VNVRGFNAGVELQSDGNAVRFSRLGTSPNGNVADPNTDAGIVVKTDDSLIGGPTLLDRNLISGNTLSGIFVAEATGTRIEGNLIGTDSSGGTALANGNGVLVAEEAADTTVGGTEPGTHNVISGNRSDGVQSGDGRVVGNRIGLDVDGTALLPNGETGVTALEPIQIGGTSEAERNLIAGHETAGVLLRAAATVQGNWIGLAPDGANLPPDFNGTGIRIHQDLAGALVGGVEDGAGTS